MRFNTPPILQNVQIILPTTLFMLALTFTTLAQSEETIVAVTSPGDASTATTATSLLIVVEDLKLLVKPMTVEELQSEAAAWFDQLKSANESLSAAEIALQKAARDDTPTDMDVSQVLELESTQGGAADRLEVVLSELEGKGGDVSGYRKYLEATTGGPIDVSDGSRLGLRAWNWLKAPDGGRLWVMNMAKFIIIVLVVNFLAGFLGARLDVLLSRSKKVTTLIRQFVVTSIKRGGLIVGILLGLAAMNISLGPIFAVVGAASFVLAFALQSSLANLASGLMLMFNKPFDVGDEVKVGTHWAYVESISLSNTVLKGFDGSIITLPNSAVWGGEITNYTHSDTRKIVIPIRIRFTEDIDRVTVIWNELASSCKLVLDDPGPGIFAYAGSPIDYSVPVSLMAWANTNEFWDAYTDILKGLQKRVVEENIELAPPLQEVHLKGGSELPGGQQLGSV